LLGGATGAMLGGTTIHPHAIQALLKSAGVVDTVKRAPITVGEEIGKRIGTHYKHDKAIGTAALGAAGAAAAGGAAMASKKEASDQDLVQRLRSKVAEDAINPAQISGGKAIPLETNEAGQSTGFLQGGAPGGAAHLLNSAETVRNATRRDAYANRKQELRSYFKEPALSAATDKTLSQAFSHTSEAGPKIASDESTKSAAARVLLERLRSNQPGKE
jgi:hypothetical protein